jgi:hypothetical protein
MEKIPFYIPAVFVATTAITLFLLFRASGNRKQVLTVSLLWLAVQAALGLSDFYLLTGTTPPRFAVAVIPPLMLIVFGFATKRGRAFINRFNTKWLTLLHAVRFPVEMVLLWLFLQKYVPELMTFEGRNFDILSGITAPLVFYFGYVRKKLSRNVLLGWNFLCLVLLFNIVINAILSAPSAFQQFAFDQPNVGVLYFPFIWLPSFIVPAVLFSHLASIRSLLGSQVQTVRHSPALITPVV